MRIFDDAGRGYKEKAEMLQGITTITEEYTQKIIEKYPDVAPQDIMWTITNTITLKLLFHNALRDLDARKS